MPSTELSGYTCGTHACIYANTHKMAITLNTQSGASYCSRSENTEDNNPRASAEDKPVPSRGQPRGIKRWTKKIGNSRRKLCCCIPSTNKSHLGQNRVSPHPSNKTWGGHLENKHPAWPRYISAFDYLFYFCLCQLADYIYAYVYGTIHDKATSRHCGMMVKSDLPTDLASQKVSPMPILHLELEGDSRRVLTMLGGGNGRSKRKRC